MYRYTMIVEVPDEVVHQMSLTEWWEYFVERAWIDPERLASLSYAQVAEVLAARDVSWGLQSSLSVPHKPIEFSDKVEYVDGNNVRNLRMPPLGLCNNREDHEPHDVYEGSLAPFRCTANQTQREPYASEQRRANAH